MGENAVSDGVLMAAEMAEGCFANRLRTASRAISRRYDAALKPLDLKISQLSVLTAVKIGAGTLTIVEMAERLGMDRSTLSRNLDPLERRGLLVLGPEERHRARRVTLTPEGNALIAAAYPLWKRAQAAAAEAVVDLPTVAKRLDLIQGKLG